MDRNDFYDYDEVMKMYFYKEIFEKLLFKLNDKIYQKINRLICNCISCDKNFIQKSFYIFEKMHNIAGTSTVTVDEINIEQERVYRKMYSITIVVNIFSDDYRIDNKEKINDYCIGVDPDNSGWKMLNEYPGNTLVVNIGQRDTYNSYDTNKRIYSYKIPLEYVMGFKMKDILNKNSYQLYMHTICPQNKHYNEKYLRENAFLYIGITGRSWQIRYKEHNNNMRKGSQLLFHQALRGEINKEKINIGIIEHCVEKAGLTENEALDLEEKEVDHRSWYLKHKLGLNRIPGGKAGLKYIKNFVNHNKIKRKKNVTAENKEDMLVDLQLENMHKLSKSLGLEYRKEKMHELWKNIEKRIELMTKQYNRFSYNQINTARTLHFSGYSIEKIFEVVKDIDNSKVITIDRLEKLLKGETYETIPYNI